MPRLFLALLILFTARASADKLEPRVLFLGDSITYGGNWITTDTSAMQFGILDLLQVTVFVSLGQAF